MRILAVTLTIIAVIAAAATPTAGAQGEEMSSSLHTVGTALLNYLPNRVNDIVDTVHASVGFGLGYGLSIRATTYAAMDITDARTLRFGFDEGGVLPQVWDESLESNGAALWKHECGEINRDPAEVGAGVHLGIIGADAAIDCYEVIDALLGFVFVDISEDDEGPVIASRRSPY